MGKVINVKALKQHIFKHIETTCMKESDKGTENQTAAEAAAQSTQENGAVPSANPTAEPEMENGEAMSLKRPWSSMSHEVHRGETTFADTVLSLKGMDQKQLTQISIPFCFMCTSHLANEKNLRFVGLDVDEGQALTNFAITV